MSTSSATDHKSDPATLRQRARSTWLISLTAVCFLFGGLMAMQLRAIETVRDNSIKEEKGLKQQQHRVQEMRAQLTKEAKEREKAQNLLKKAQLELNKKGSLSQQQVNQLNAEIKKMQMIAGLTPVSGPGITIRVSDDASVAKAGGVPLPGGFQPGIVHDYDVQMVVNELRAAKAEAIAINGTRVTGYTPIRCVGPTILVNWEPVAAPFVIEAIGRADDLASSVNMPNGIVDGLTNNGLGVKVETAEKLVLPAAEGVPTIRVAKPEKA